MKENQVKMREDDSQQYKFRSREFKIENVIELDISTLGKSLANESFLEWKELVLEDEQSVRYGNYLYIFLQGYY